MTDPIRSYRNVTALDCSDARSLADFYATLLGWRVSSDDAYPEWVDVLPPEHEPQNIAIGCQRIDGYRAPTWPEGPVPQQVHLDFYVDSVEAAAPLAEAAGAVRHEVQPSEDGRFIVFTDPAGHPFCLCEQ